MFRFLVLIALTVLLGCGQAGPKVAKTRGKVIYKNTPLKFGSVVFQHESGRMSSGKIETDGSFEMTTTKPGDGAIVGKNRIRVTCTTAQDPNAKKQLKEGQELPAGKSLIPEIYADLQQTPLNEEVKDIELNTFTFELSK